MVIFIRFSFFSLLCWGVITVGCGSTGRLSGKLHLLEKEMSDLRQSNRRMEQRIDELQIQVSLLMRKANSIGDTSGLPDLKVVRLHPTSHQKNKDNKKQTVTNSLDMKKEGPNRRIQMGSVDPKQVSERLPVDHQAAQRSLFDPKTSEKTEPDDGVDEETIATEYNQALALFQSADYRQAVSTLVDFSQRFSEHPLAQDALFVIGQSRFALSEYKVALQDFLVFAQKNPDHKRAAEALLMAGHCDEEMGLTKNARSIYLQLVQAYPLSEEAQKANQRLGSIQ